MASRLPVCEPLECSRCAFGPPTGNPTWTAIGAVYDTRTAYASLIVWWRCMDCYVVTISGGLLHPMEGRLVDG